MFGPTGANTSWSRTPETRGRSRKAIGSIAIGTSLNRQLLLARSVATMLPRLGSTRGDSRRLEGRLHGWNVMTDKDLLPEALCHHQLSRLRGSGSTPCASTTDPPLPLYEECFRCASIAHGSVRLNAGRRAGPHASGSTGTSCAAVRLSCASVRRPRVRVAGRRAIVVR